MHFHQSGPGKSTGTSSVLFRGGNAIPRKTGEKLDKRMVPVRPALWSWNAHVLPVYEELSMLAEIHEAGFAGLERSCPRQLDSAGYTASSYSRVGAAFLFTPRHLCNCSNISLFICYLGISDCSSLSKTIEDAHHQGMAGQASATNLRGQGHDIEISRLMRRLRTMGLLNRVSWQTISCLRVWSHQRPFKTSGLGCPLPANRQTCEDLPDV